MIEFRHCEPQTKQPSSLAGSIMSSINALIAVAGFAAGFVIAWLLGRNASQSRQLELEKRAANQQGAAAELNKQSTELQGQVRTMQGRIEEEQKRDRHDE